jgi:urease accessory protein
MKASAVVVAEHRNGRTVIADLRSEPPIALRETAMGLAIVGSAAGPVGGDELEMSVRIGDHASLRIETVATTMVWPGPAGEVSHQDLHIAVGVGGHLTWIGQPLLVVHGGHHVQRVTIDLAADATLEFIDEIALGRSGEQPGRLESNLRVIRDGVPLIDQHQDHDPESAAWSTSAGAGGHRHVTHHLVVGAPARSTQTSIEEQRAAARFPLADDAELMITVAASRCDALRRSDGRAANSCVGGAD